MNAAFFEQKRYSKTFKKSYQSQIFNSGILEYVLNDHVALNTGVMAAENTSCIKIENCYFKFE